MAHRAAIAASLGTLSRFSNSSGFLFHRLFLQMSKLGRRHSCGFTPLCRPAILFYHITKLHINCQNYKPASRMSANTLGVKLVWTAPPMAPRKQRGDVRPEICYNVDVHWLVRDI